MTTSMQVQTVKPTWDLRKLQEAATKHAAHRIISRLHFIEKHPGKEIDELEQASAHLKAEFLKKCAVKSPMDLVKHIAEFEVNMYGTEASIQGDEHNAILVTNNSTVWQEVKKLGNITKEQEAKVQSHYRQWVESLAQGFGFKAQVEVTNEGNGSKITFNHK